MQYDNNRLTRYFESTGDFAHVPDYARNGMTDQEMDEELKNMGLSPEWENIIRSACKYGITKT